MEIALASLFTMKYGSIIVLQDIDYARALPLFGLRQNIYTDPKNRCGGTEGLSGE
jgi:acetyl-CoA decarbonylase/synthase complex subunit gamma